MITVNVELSKDELFEALTQEQFTENEKLELLKSLFPQRGFTDKQRLMGEITEFIFKVM